MSLSIAWSLEGESEVMDGDQSNEREWCSALSFAIETFSLLALAPVLLLAWFIDTTNGAWWLLLTNESLTLRLLRGGSGLSSPIAVKMLPSESVSDLERHLPRRLVPDAGAAPLLLRGVCDARLLRVI